MPHTCQPLPCESALHKLKRRIPYGWDLNPYRGCAHGCRYCYALYSHKGLHGGFHTHIYAKTNLAERLERELAAPGWQREVVNIGGVTDAYQPAEAHQALMPDILRLLIRYKTPAIISTKSALVLRDFDLIDELSRLTYVNVAASVITVDESLRQTLEPGAAPAKARLAMLKEFRKTNASTGLHCMPIIPHLTDGADALDALFSAAAHSGVHYLLPGTLYLRGQTRPAFFAYIQQIFPHLYEPLQALYKTGGAPPAYKEGLYQTVNALREKYGLSSSYTKPMREKLAAAQEAEQLSFLEASIPPENTE